MPISAQDYFRQQQDDLARRRWLQGQNPTTVPQQQPRFTIPQVPMGQAASTAPDLSLPSHTDIQPPTQPMSAPIAQSAQPNQFSGWSERLPGGQSVYQAVANAARNPTQPTAQPAPSDPYGLHPATPTAPVGGTFTPQQHHGFWDRLKMIGEGALQGMQYGPGGAVAGAITGGVAPGRIDLMRFRQRQQQQEAEQYRQNELQKQQAEIDRLNRPPVPQRPDYQTRQDELGNTIRQQWNPQTGQLEDVPGQAGIVKRPTPKTPQKPIFQTRTNADGSQDVFRSDDNGLTFQQVQGLGKAAPAEKPDKVAARQDQERQLRINSSRSTLLGHYNAEAEAKQRADAAQAALRDAQSKLDSNDPRTKAALEEAQANYKNAQAEYAAFGGKKAAAFKEFGENGGQDFYGFPRGSTITSDNVDVVAQKLGLSRPAAEKFIEDGGGKIIGKKRRGVAGVAINPSVFRR